MAASCTIIASDTAPVQEVIVDGETGLLVPFHDSDAIANAVVRVLEDPERYASLGEAARRVAVARFEVKVCVDQALEALGIGLADGDEIHLDGDETRRLVPAAELQ